MCNKTEKRFVVKGAIKMTEKGDYCDIECIYYYIDYETRYDSEGCPYDECISRCTLGHSKIFDAGFCKYYEERD